MNEQIDREADVREWLAYARADQQAANALFEAGLYSACAFHCQQAVEKLLKAAIVAETGKRLPFAIRSAWKWDMTKPLPKDC